MKLSRSQALRIMIKESLVKVLTLNYWVIKGMVRKELSANHGGEILDIGCGTGLLSLLFPKETYLGIDVDEELIAYAKKKYPRKFQVMNATRLAFPKNSFEKILIVGVIHHLNNEAFKRACREMKKVLKKNGKILVIEAIPPLSRGDFLKTLLRSLDKGEYVRPLRQYQEIFADDFKVLKAYPQSGGLFDYGVFLLGQKS